MSVVVSIMDIALNYDDDDDDDAVHNSVLVKYIYTYIYIHTTKFFHSWNLLITVFE